MDFNSWRPEDTARRFSLMLGGSLGTFAFIALWLGLGWHPLLAVLAGVVAGALLHLLAYPLLLAIYRR
ncbi:hypothetical protein DEIPH_ctg035orf0008 [Deinococcus phoenicis]|uniref:Uncharacterized protein n=1 Tax=Deinococcus phoenicis TaxID=1476583 RepID=A0A016QN78_9DEIO|nr:hypothetical protein [Deinococcus phoenicis]EYB67570.1 hypothetical protein DEIPH_ctg035orf0008 [Deinococcus phoenicis]